MFKHKKVHTPPADDPTSIGNLAVKEGYLTREKLSAIINEFHKHAGVMLGQFMVECGSLSPEKLVLLLLKQKAARNGGVEHEQVMEAMALATSVQHRVDIQVDRFVSTTLAAAAKVGIK